MKGLGKQGKRLSQAKQPAGGMAEVWTRQLAEGDWAILFFNRNNSAPLLIAALRSSQVVCLAGIDK